MRIFTFEDFIQANINIDADILNLIGTQERRLSFKAGEYLLQSGEICRNAFYVEQGLLRYFSIDSKGKEHILQFAPEGWFISDRESALSKKPSEYYIEALEDSQVVVIEDDYLRDLAEKYHAFAPFYYKLLQRHIRSLQNRVNQLLSFTAEERYLDLIRIYPDIQMRVPQMMIASYLGITPETLSRVRKEIANKKAGR